MGLFTDLGNFGKGMIERDRELTNEKLAIRAEELKANRDLMIAMKKDKYAADIAEYKKEKAKSNEIKQLNSAAAAGNMDNSSYAKQFLLHSLGTEKFNALQKADPAGFLDMVDNIANQAKANKGLDYKFTIDRNSLDNQFGTDTKIINKGFSKAIEDAKGDSFLINKILNKKSTIDKDVNADIESQLKAAKVVTEETIDSDKKNITFAEGTKRLRKPPEPYQTEWASQRGKINFDITKDGNAFKFLNLTAKYGGNDDLSYSFNKTDGKIDKMNEPATTNLLAMQYMFNEVKNSDDTMSLHYNTVTKNKGDIGKTWNADTVYKTMSSLLDGRGGNIQEKGLDFKTDYRLTTFVPLSLVNQNNKMEFANGTVIDFKDKSKMKALSTVMNNYIIDKTNTIYKNDNSVSEQGIASKVYERLYTGESETMKEFLTFAMTNKKKGNPELFKDIITTAESAVAETEGTTTEGTAQDKTLQDNKPKDKKSKIKFVVTKVKGKDGLAANGVFKSWEQLENDNKINLLPEVQKIEYNKWKAKQKESQVKGTTFEEIQANTDVNTKKITDAFTDTKGNFEKMKTNKTNIRPFNKG
jgi:hypothetical protein